MKTKLVLGLLITIIAIESIMLALPYASQLSILKAPPRQTLSESTSFPFTIFNQPISNDTEHELNPPLPGSWLAEMQSSLVPSSGSGLTEAEIAFAPAYPVEYKSIPAIIIQERADGLVRVEYFAQNWPNTTGLLLYNSSTPGWIGESKIDIIFTSSGPPSTVNPQLAPRPNGTVSINIRGVTLLSDYPIAWANLSDLYLYGYPGSSFASGSVRMSFYRLTAS